MDSSSKSSAKTVSALPNYKFGKTLGSGSFAKVKLALHLATRQKVAIKIISRRNLKNDLELEAKVHREIKVLRSLSHPHIIRQYEVIETARHIYVVMEYVSGELFDYIVEKGRLPEEEALHLFQQIISGVEYCHSNRIVHRDLKPENVLLDSKKNIKIADFGLSNVMQDGHLLKTSCGSPNYAAPEILSGQPYSGPEVDVWSCGVILYGLLCGTLPFDDENIANLFQKIKSGVYTLPGHLSNEARDLIPRMLMVDPLMRIRISEIRQHPWFNNHLSRYLIVPPLYITEQAQKINEEIVQEVVSKGFDRNHLIESLLNRIQNQATVTYHLLLDSQSKAKESSSDATLASRISFEMVPSYVGHPFAALDDDHEARLRSENNVERNWTLGIQSQASPDAIMSEVFNAFKNMNVLWKRIGPYNIKCVWISSSTNDETHKNTSLNSSLMDVDEGAATNSSVAIKFELQLYKVSEGKYLVDIQKVDGPQFLFFHVSVALLRELGVI